MVQPSQEHESCLEEAIKKLEAEGYRVIKTNRKIPDAIAAKDGKVFAVEMMGQRWTKNKEWENAHTKREKQIAYEDFDGLLFFTFRYKKKAPPESESISQPQNTSL